MIFKNYSESAKLLAEKIKELMDDVETPRRDVSTNLKHVSTNLKHVSTKYNLTFINSESSEYAQKIAEYLNTDLNESTKPQNLVIIDNGATLAEEYNEYTDELRKTHPTTNIIIAIPIIPESEIETLQKNCDTLLYLHTDPYFFSINQFYEQASF